MPDAGLRRYGYSQVGEPCAEVQRYTATPNITLNFLAGIEGVKNANVVEGATNMIEFSRLFEEAANAADPLTGRPALEVDDMIIVDNRPIHHDMSIELLHLPIYSPDLNPVEQAFSNMKNLLKYRHRELVFRNLELAVLHVVQDIGPEDLPGYFGQYKLS